MNLKLNSVPDASFFSMITSEFSPFLSGRIGLIKVTFRDPTVTLRSASFFFAFNGRRSFLICSPIVNDNTESTKEFTFLWESRNQYQEVKGISNLK